ncbi:hypothetical protein H2201_008317 [Coniosporium apollinis]|uniref:beta-glucosidase n=1 Tax=Coniosporium apollinis TaxID=61459 RepID=A0ABQ9NJC8_9PEZI|nr:hypothetical protein H2201_008317 [Coniosporium apollinis]
MVGRRQRSVGRLRLLPGPATGKPSPGGRKDLFDVVATISATITNSGRAEGAEVAQLPPRQLRGFQKLRLRPGQSKTARFELRRRDISYWDVGMQKWVVPKGHFGVVVGASSRDARLNGTIVV